MVAFALFILCHGMESILHSLGHPYLSQLNFLSYRFNNADKSWIRPYLYVTPKAVPGEAVM